MKKRIVIPVIIIILAVAAAAVYFMIWKNKDGKNTSGAPEVIDTDMDGLVDDEDPNPDEWDVTDHDLAIFARLAYYNGSDVTGGMYDPQNMRLDEDEPEIDLRDKEQGIFERWILENYHTEKTMGAEFCASTFKNGKNVVVAFRGTDDSIEWVWNFVGIGLIDYHIEEAKAVEYIKEVVKKYPDCNIYITGHSLGGYLAQVSAAHMIKYLNRKPAAVVYFNGVGLDYNQKALDSKEWAREVLKEYSNTNRLVSYQVRGDVVSLIGIHSGQQIFIEPDREIIEKASQIEDESSWSKNLGLIGTSFIEYKFGNDVADCYTKYKAKSLFAYLSITHDANNFIRIKREYQ